MSQPPPNYNRQFSFESFSTNNPTGQQPGNQIDNELNNISASVNQTISRLSELQRADGKLKETALDNTAIIASITYQAYNTLAEQIAPMVTSASADAASALASKNSAHNSAQSSSASAATAEAARISAQGAAAQAFAAESQVNAKLDALSASAQTAASAATSANAAKSAAQAAAGDAQSSAQFALAIKTYLDSEYFEVLDSWQNLNDLQNKHQAREHLGVQGDTSHAALYHEFKSTLRYFRPPQSGAAVDDADQLLRKWFGLVFNTTTDKFDLIPDWNTNWDTTIFTPWGPIKWQYQGYEGLNQQYPNVAWDMTVEQRVDILRMKLRSFGVVLTNSMMFLRNERQGKYVWPCFSNQVDQVTGSAIPGTEWSSVYSGGRPFNWDEVTLGTPAYVPSLIVPADVNRFITLEDFAQADVPGNPQQIQYVTGYIDSLIKQYIPYPLSIDKLNAIQLAQYDPTQYNPFVTQQTITQDVIPLIRNKVHASINWTGDYDALATYNRGDGVKFNGAWYVARDFEDLFGGVSGSINPGQDPSVNPELWTKLIPDGVGGNPFDQTLNTADTVAFDRVDVKSGSMAVASLYEVGSSTNIGVQAIGGSGFSNVQPYLKVKDFTSGNYLTVTGAGITFGDNTTQTTAGISAGDAAATYYPLTNPSGYITSAALVGYATETYVNSQGFITSSALSPYLLSSTAASTYQPISGMSAYATLSGAIFTGEVSVPTPPTIASGDVVATCGWVKGFGYLVSSDLSPYLLSSTAASTYQTISGMSSYAAKASSNTFTANQIIEVTDNTNAALRVTQLGTGYAIRVEDNASPDNTPFAVDATGNVGIRSQPNSSYFLTAGGINNFTVGSGGNTSINTDPDVSNQWSIKVGARNQSSTEYFGYLNGGFEGAGIYVTDTSSDPLLGTGNYVAVTRTGVIGYYNGVAAFRLDTIAQSFFLQGLYVPTGKTSSLATASATTPTAGDNSTRVATTAFVNTYCPTASTSTAGKVRLATDAEARTKTDTSKAVTPSNLVQLNLGIGRMPYIIQSFSTATSGTGGLNDTLVLSRRTTGPTSTGAGYVSANQGMVPNRGQAQSLNIDWTKRIRVFARLQRDASSPSNNSIYRFTLGEPGSSYTGDPTVRSIGIKITGTGVINALAHDGTTLTTIATTYTPTNGSAFDLVMESDGAGNITWSADGTQIASTALGPKTYLAGANSQNNLYTKVENTSSFTSAAQSYLCYVPCGEYLP